MFSGFSGLSGLSGLRFFHEKRVQRYNKILDCANFYEIFLKIFLKVVQNKNTNHWESVVCDFWEVEKFSKKMILVYEGIGF